MLTEIGKRYLDKFFDFNEAYVAEIEGIASGAGIEPWQIALLNARNEVHHYLKGRLNHNECTAVFLPESGILAQNWDWVHTFEKLFVIILLERPDGHKTLQMTEPGVIGKIGFNTSGVGVCLNFLPGRNNDIGIPVHLLMRSVLDSASIEEARDIILEADVASFSNLLVGDRSGAYFDFEFYKNNKTPVNYPNQLPLHTNHYLNTISIKAPDKIDSVEKELYQDSVIRCNQAKKILAQSLDQNVELAKRMLGDRENGSHAICAEYKSIMGAQIGTVCSIVMDLKKLEMHVRKGNSILNQYEVVGL
jgi:isopenicillin-N N-acyltransferase-like protein